MMCDSCKYQGALVIARELLDSEQYKFAHDTVRGIMEWVEREKHVTDRQTQALVNIQNSKPDVDSDARWRREQQPRGAYGNRPAYPRRRR